jgi:hypothetical protein
LSSDLNRFSLPYSDFGPSVQFQKPQLIQPETLLW